MNTEKVIRAIWNITKLLIRWVEISLRELRLFAEEQPCCGMRSYMYTNELLRICLACGLLMIRHEIYTSNIKRNPLAALCTTTHLIFNGDYTNKPETSE